jgi:DNA repair exonuclease SbcCD ATPase subunit
VTATEDALLRAAIGDLQERVQNLQGALRNRDREVSDLLSQLGSHHRYIAGLTGEETCPLCEVRR